MILTAEEIKKRKLIQNIIGDIQYQQAGIDLTLREVYKFNSPGKIDFDNKERKISDVEPIPFEGDELFLKPGVYKIVYNEYVKIPLDFGALILTRSSLLRSGAYIEGAFWDPGYEGVGSSLLVVSNPHGIILKKNARIVQMIFLKLNKEASSYEGVYKYKGAKNE